MPNLNPGDLVTFPLRADTYGVALVVHVDDLPLNDLYHFAICDAVVAGEEAGEDEFGAPLPREHDMDVVGAAPILIEHVALTRHGLEASDLSIVADREVSEEQLEGYRTWLHLRYQDAVRRGMVRERIDDNPEEEYDESELDEETAEMIEEQEVGGDDDELDRAGGDAGTGAVDASRMPAGSSADDASGAGEARAAGAGDDAADADATGAGTAVGVAAGDEEVSAATLGVHDVGLGTALIRQRAIFERPAYRDSTLGRYITQLGEDNAAIDEIVERLLEGDFGAGDELIDYGEAGMRALGRQLRDGIAPELADDILQVLVNSGETVAYERVGEFMALHGRVPNDPLHRSAVRGYCYAVMLTAGEPEALKEHLALLEDIRDPELADDVRAARKALAGEG